MKNLVMQRSSKAITMKPVTLTINNDLESLVVLQSAVHAFVEAIGADSTVARQMERVVKVLITNVIRFEYLPGQKEQIELHLACESREIVLTIRFKGIPFDIEFLQRCEQAHAEEVSRGDPVGRSASGKAFL